MGDISTDFNRSEFACKCGCGADGISPQLVDLLQMLREAIGRPLAITSGVRCPKHNQRCGGKPNSAHLTGDAADITCSTSQLRMQLVSLAQRAGVRRIGVHKTFVHLDIAGGVEHPQDVLWLY